MILKKVAETFFLLSCFLIGCKSVGENQFPPRPVVGVVSFGSDSIAIEWESVGDDVTYIVALSKSRYQPSYSFPDSSLIDKIRDIGKNTYYVWDSLTASTKYYFNVYSEWENSYAPSPNFSLLDSLETLP